MNDTKITWSDQAAWMKDKWEQAGRTIYPDGDDFRARILADNAVDTVFSLVEAMAKRLDEIEQAPRAGDCSIIGIGTARAGWLHATRRGAYFQDREDEYDELLNGELEPGEAFWLYPSELGAVGGIDGPDPKLARGAVEWHDDGVLLRVEPTGEHERGGAAIRPQVQYRIVAVHSPEEAR